MTWNPSKNPIRPLRQNLQTTLEFAQIIAESMKSNEMRSCELKGPE